MSEEQINKLLYEIETDEDGIGFIDCGTATDYTDEHLYERIITAVKQNVELQKANKDLTKKLEEVEKQEMESLLKIETIAKEKEEAKQQFIMFMSELCNYLSTLKNIKFPLRIGDYKFEVIGKDLLVYNYDPVKKTEPIEISLEVVTPDENESLNGICPNCQGELGEYPAISRKDNKTMICPGCGMLEAILIWKEKNNEKQSI